MKTWHYSEDYATYVVYWPPIGKTPAGIDVYLHTTVLGSNLPSGSVWMIPLWDVFLDVSEDNL